jgi:hypothetical protein
MLSVERTFLSGPFQNTKGNSPTRFAYGFDQSMRSNNPTQCQLPAKYPDTEACLTISSSSSSARFIKKTMFVCWIDR